MQEISLAMIVKNEAAHLEGCLESAANWVDEIVIVDTGSTDGTQDIARHYTRRLFELPWPDSFSVARNYAIDQAGKQWIFWLDADDLVPEETGARLRMLASGASADTGFFAFNYTYPSGLVQKRAALFRNQPDIRFTGRVHEQIYDPLTANLGLREISLPILHTGGAGGPEKEAFYLSLLEKDAVDRPNDYGVHFHLGMAYAASQPKKAITALNNVISLGAPSDAIEKAQAVLASLVA